MMRFYLFFSQRLLMLCCSLLFSITVFAQQPVQVSGVVRDEVGPIGGVSVLVKGTQQGTVTSATGAYTISAAPGSVLVFRSIGYDEQERTVAGAGTINVTLASGSEGLEEVVIVGYGTQRSTDVTGSVSTVTMGNVRDQALASPDQALQGQVAGVNVSTSNGIPGGGPQIRVRGVGAVGAASEPLYVIDGFPVPSSSSQRTNPMSEINPQDIESMTILKDASATAIYGSRGANGVVIINTKKGRSGKPTIAVTASTGFQEVPQKGRPDLMNGQEFAQWRQEAEMDKIRYEQGREPSLDEIPEIYRNPSLIGKGTDWYDEVTRVAPMSDVNLSVSGGSDNVRAYVSAGYFNQQGVMLNTGFERYSLRTNVDASLTDKFRVGVSLSPSLTYTNGNVRGQGRDEFFEIANPIPPVYNEDGSYNVYIQTPGTFGNPNPVMVLNETVNKSNSARVLFNIFGEYDLVKNLKFKSTFNVDYGTGDSEYFRPSILRTQNNPNPSIPSGSYTSRSSLNWLNENTLNYDLRSDNHSFSALVGFTTQSNKSLNGSFTGNEFANDDIQTLNAAARITGNTNKQEWGLVSYLARVNYGYMDKYLVTATVRSDGSSRFGSDNRWGTFPSVALGWKLSDENFLKDVEWLNEFKLRASYGFSGNFNIGNYSYMSNIGSDDYVFNGSLASGRYKTNLANSFLGWEKMREFNLGYDLAILSNRLTMTADFYIRNTQDLLLESEIPQSSGYSTAMENRGDIRNQGLELGINSRNINREDFRWSTNFNISFNKNKVIALGRSTDPLYSGSSSEGNPTNISVIGQPLGMLIGYRVEGIYQNQADLDKYPKFPGAIPGNMRFKDVNGDGEITPFADFEVIGNPYPDFTWGLTNSFNYKNLDLRFLIVGAMGAEMLRATSYYTWNIDGVFNVTRDVADRWKSESNPGKGIVPTTAGEGRGRVMFRDSHSGMVHKTDYAWVKNITLGYTFKNGIGNNFLKTARIYGSVQNVLAITKYPGNPEGTNYNRSSQSSLVPGLDYSNYPVPRIFTLGTNFTF